MRTLYGWILKAEAVVAATFLVVMVVLIFLGGVARTLGQPMNWTTDVATALFAWACFLCADIAWRRNSLMSIDLATDLMPQRLRAFCRHASHLIVAGFLVYLIGWGTWLSYVSRARSFQGIPEISYSWVTMSLPVGGLLLLATTALKVRDDLRAAAGRAPAPGAAG
ncbi:MAG: TRAP transporter small permease [Alphaproteobacteria bacterium]|nr:TRAP transporter small permease [Alphaproteobacteria bacterium]